MLYCSSRVSLPTFGPLCLQNPALALNRRMSTNMNLADHLRAWFHGRGLMVSCLMVEAAIFYSIYFLYPNDLH